MPKPSSLPRWADLANPADVVNPPSGKKDSGWLTGEKPPHSYFNWWMNLVYQWTQYLDGLTGEALTWTAAHIFNLGITVSTTATLVSNAAIKGNGNSLAAGVWGAAANASGGIGVKGTAVHDNAGAAEFTSTGNAPVIFVSSNPTVPNAPLGIQIGVVGDNGTGIDSAVTGNSAVAILATSTNTGGKGVHADAGGTSGRAVNALANGTNGRAISATATGSGGRSVHATGPVEIISGDLIIPVTGYNIKYPSDRTEWAHIPLSTFRATEAAAQGSFKDTSSGTTPVAGRWFSLSATHHFIHGGDIRVPAAALIDRIEVLCTNNDSVSRNLEFFISRSTFTSGGITDVFTLGTSASPVVATYAAGNTSWVGTAIASNNVAPDNLNGVADGGGLFTMRIKIPQTTADDDFKLVAVKIRYQYTTIRTSN